MSQTLLPSPETVFPDDPATRNTYQRVYSLQDQQPLRMAILGWMLIHAPWNKGRAEVARDINAAVDDQGVFNVGAYYENFFVQYFRLSAKKHITAQSSHSSDSEAIQQEIQSGPMVPATNHSTAKTQALIRDNFRCILSGLVDTSSYRSMPHLQAESLSNPQFSCAPTTICYIFPRCLTQGPTTTESEDNPSIVFTVLQRYGGIEPGELRGDGVYQLCNVLTLLVGVDECFNNLDMWLEPVEGQSHRYHLGRWHTSLYRYLPDVHDLATTHAHLALPDRRYLALHAALAKVVQMSGTREFVEKILEDIEDTKVLSEDGSSGQLLDFLFPKESVVVS